MSRLCSLLAIGLVISGCATHDGTPGSGRGRLQGPELQITGVEIYNSLMYPVRDVTILVPASGDYVSCGQIFPETSCATTFPGRDYRENPVQLSWTEHGQPQSTKPFTLKAPAGTRAGQAATIRVEVFAAGQAGATLILVEP